MHATKSGVTHFTYQDETSRLRGDETASVLSAWQLSGEACKELVDETNGKKSLLYALNTLVRGKKMDTQDYCGELVDIVGQSRKHMMCWKD